MPSSIPPVSHPSAPPKTSPIDLELIDRNAHQPRSETDAAALAELMASISEQGLLQPITVRKVGARYQVIAGHRRLEAFRRLLSEARPIQAAIERFRTIPAHEKFDVTDEEMALFALIETFSAKGCLHSKPPFACCAFRRHISSPPKHCPSAQAWSPTASRGCFVRLARRRWSRTPLNRRYSTISWTSAARRSSVPRAPRSASEFGWP